MSILERIKRLEKLPPSEAKVANFLETHYPLTAFETISSLSQKAGVGKATVGRFIKRLGYESFSQFLKDTRSEVVSRLESPIERYSMRKEQLNEKSNDSLRLHINYTIKNLDDIRAQNSPELFHRAAELLSNCENRLYIMGSATAYALAYYFYLLARYLRDGLYLLQPNTSTLPHQLIDVTDKDVLLVITQYRFSAQTVKVAEWFSGKKSKIVLVADRQLNPVTDIANIQLVSSSEGPPLFNSRCGTLVILEAMLTAMTSLLEDRVYPRFTKFEELRKEFGTFAPWHSEHPLENSKLYKSGNESDEL